MRSFAREAHLLLLGTLLGMSVGCAEGPSADGEGFTSAYPFAEAGLQPDAARSVSETSQSDSDLNTTSSDSAAGMSTPAASFDAAADSLLDASAGVGTVGSAASSLGTSTSDALTMSSDASSTTGSLGANAPDAGSARTDSGVATTSDSGALCNPRRCNNRCALLMRCCNSSDQCACLDPGTRMCTLASL